MGQVSLPAWVEQIQTQDKLRDTAEAYKKVPMLYRAINLRADAISSVPFRVERNGEPSEWYFKTDLSELLRETETSLLLSGAAFWLKIMRGRVLVGFKVMNPFTMTVTLENEGLNPANLLDSMRFTQSINGQTYGPWTSEHVIYFRENSYDSDVGHGLAPAEVAMQACQQAYYLERFTGAFFEHGAQPITIVSVPTDTSETELKRFSKNWIDKFTGVVNAFRPSFIRGGDIKTTVITPPLKDLMLPELTERSITEVAMALNVPRTMLEASAANYATSMNDRMSFYQDTIIPRLSKYRQTINDQLMTPLGYELIFQPEALSILQEDEAQRAASLKLLTDAGVPLNDGMIILGYDYEITATNVPTYIEPIPVAKIAEVAPKPVDDTPLETNAGAPVPDQAQTKDYTLWRRKAEKRLLANKSLDFEFASAEIDAEDLAWIRYNLTECKSIHDIKHLFDEVKTVGVNDAERPLYNSIYSYLRKKGNELSLILAGGQLNELPPEFFFDMPDAMVSFLASHMQDVLLSLQDRYTVDIDDALEQSLINKQIDAYMPKLIKGLTDTTSTLVKTVIDRARANGGMTNDEIMAQLLPAFGKRRSEMIAITEYTRSASNATSVYQTYLEDYGIKATRVWNTENDEISRKCPICAPLNGKTEDVWAEKYPAGAPAHPRCRCDISIKIGR
jgi:HK97 family phage portal protein